MSRSEQGACGSIGCLFFGILAGALAVWLTSPYWQSKGIVPEKFRKGAVSVSKYTSEMADKLTDFLQKDDDSISSEIKETVSDIKDGIREVKEEIKED